MGALQDKVAIITGAASGIGLACAERFARERQRISLALPQIAAHGSDRSLEALPRGDADVPVEAGGRGIVQELEHSVEVLSDRMTHDPFLSASLHEVLSTVTAIRSTAFFICRTLPGQW